MKLDKMALPLCKAFESLPSKSLPGNYCRQVLQQDLARRLVTATPALLVGDSRLGFERVLHWGRDGRRYRHKLCALLIFQEEKLAKCEQEGLEQDRVTGAVS